MEISNDIKDFLEEQINNSDGEIELDLWAEQYLADDRNYNNADITSNQKCFEYNQIIEQLKEYWEELRQEPDRCFNCGKKLEDDEFIGEYEYRGEFWGAPCSEYVTYGYKCFRCEFKEEW